MLIILKIICIIILSVIALILFILAFPVKVRVEYAGGDLNFKVRFLLFVIVRYPEKPVNAKKMKRKKRGHKKNVKQFNYKKHPPVCEDNDPVIEEPTNKTKSPEYVSETYNMPKKDNSRKRRKKNSRKKLFGGSLTEKISEFIRIFEISGKYLKRLLKGINIYNLRTDIIVSDEDAYDCALKYGRTCIAVYNGLSLLDAVFSVKAKKIGVRCDFDGAESVYDASADISFRLFTAVSVLAGFLMTYYFKIKRPRDAAMKNAA